MIEINKIGIWAGLWGTLSSFCKESFSSVEPFPTELKREGSSFSVHFMKFKLISHKYLQPGKPERHLKFKKHSTPRQSEKSWKTYMKS